ncbi:MAG: questin oxidase family protein, partial [Stackebrandtia sp.]
MTTQRDQELLNEAYQRLHLTGPELEGWNSNHGPMAVEALASHGQADAIHGWIDDYAPLLEDLPRPSAAITADNWRDALGDPRRLGDWPGWFRNALTESDWTQVLATWWPRLLPGIAASATHGVIRVGHAVRTLRDNGTNPQRLEELAQALGYWAARWRPTAQVTDPAGDLDAATALANVSAVPQQTGNINDRLDQLG